MERVYMQTWEAMQVHKLVLDKIKQVFAGRVVLQYQPHQIYYLGQSLLVVTGLKLELQWPQGLSGTLESGAWTDSMMPSLYPLYQLIVLGVMVVFDMGDFSRIHRSKQSYSLKVLLQVHVSAPAASGLCLLRATNKSILFSHGEALWRHLNR
jgi:hypothetical protein